MAFLVDLGEITDTPAPFVFTIGALRSPSVEVINLTGELELRIPYYMSSNLESIHDLVNLHLHHYRAGYTNIARPDIILPPEFHKREITSRVVRQ